ncbi:MAG: hypothetical protein JJU28_01345 [Cyclobacteriaceae bacterium]|nr:hypothetical protein [Cyclobacteriaceae bacterium]
MEDDYTTKELPEKTLQLAERIHQLLNLPSSDFIELIDSYQQVENASELSDIYQYLFTKYDYVPGEVIPGLFESKQMFALAYTENYIRKPTEKNKKLRDEIYIGLGLHEHLHQETIK